MFIIPYQISVRNIVIILPSAIKVPSTVLAISIEHDTSHGKNPFLQKNFLN